jgi:hypothetical protein
MKEFFVLEGVYIIISLFILAITLYVTTRPFMPKSSIKKGLISVISICAFFIGLHFYITTSRMSEVREAFNNNKEILCESRMNRKAAQSIIIKKEYGWELQDDLFVSKNYTRPFHLSRCIVK